MPSSDVKCWVPRLEVPFHRKGIGNGDSPLCKLFNSSLNSISIDPTKIDPEFFIIRHVIINNMFVGPKNMLVGPDGLERGQWLG